MLTIDRKNAPAVKLVEFLKNVDVEQFRLSNGIPVYVINEGQHEVLRIELVFEAGNFYQQQKQIAKATNTLLPNGTGSHSADEISEHFDFYGAYLDTTNAKDNAYVCLYTLNKHLENTLPMLAELIMDPVFPENELEIYRTTRKQHLGVNLQKVKYLSKVFFHEQVFGKSHPYGMRLQPEHLDELNREDLMEHHRNHYRPEECTMVISGKIPVGFEQQLENYFGGFKSNGHKAAAHSIPPIISSAEKSRFIPKKDSLQAALRMGKPIINRLHPDYPELFITNVILGGYFGSRLMHNIREDKGFTYGIGSGLVSFQQSGLFVISSEVGNDVLNAAIEEIRKEIKKLRQEPVGKEELALVKNYLMGTLMRSFDGPFAVAERLRTALEFGQDMGYYKQYAHAIQQINAEKITELAWNYLDEESMFLTVSGNGNDTSGG